MQTSNLYVAMWFLFLTGERTEYIEANKVAWKIKPLKDSTAGDEREEDYHHSWTTQSGSQHFRRFREW